MIHSIYPIVDTTIYEYYPNKNTGLDSILDLSKVLESNTIYNNRALIKFDISTIKDEILKGNITNPKFYLNLYTVDAQEIPVSHKIEVLPLAEDWDSGVGRFISNPENVLASSWYNAFKTNNATIPWTTASYAPNTTGSYYTNPGGGVWYDNYSVTQSYNNNKTDIRVDVTIIVNEWLNNTFPNYGFVVKKHADSELDNTRFQTLQYFSADSRTVYTPKLEVAWDNSQFITGSLVELNQNKQITLYLPNLKQAYNEGSRDRIDIKVREKYPIITFATQSNYLVANYAATSSLHYSVRYADTDEVVIPFDDDYTKVGCDENGNFISMWFDGLYAEKYYKFVFRLKKNSFVEYHDNNYVFKVVK